VPRERYQADLDDLRTAVVALGDDVVEQVDMGLDALEYGDDSIAHSAIDGDEAINERYLELEADCIDLFALQQPVASDLRFVASSFKILTDLERVGDLATNFGKYAIGEAGGRPPDVDVVRIGRDAREMVEDAILAYKTENVARCYEIARRDDHIDALCLGESERVVRELVERQADADDSWAIERLMDDVSRLLLTIRDVERVGDHAVNVAARTLYMVEHESALLY
jgi:phosphate transport system protein